ncbi:hypothetical protein GCM10009745_35090 [Kribbella yunnanensis]|uniref:Tetratricopeptide repeat protein n=2 Tax=Kribbella yunnanensis TaxID=190194 RepID=A0ABP4TFX9_9ACTN
MRALGADGRQADALDLYSQTRRILIDQLGVEPGPALRTIHRTILRNESAAARDELPRAGSAFVGRTAELDRLTQALGALDAAVPPIVTIDGMAGAGKTALALQAARQLSARYPDGVLFVDMHGHTPGRPPRDLKSALDQLLVGAGVAVTKIPHVLEAAQGLWRTTVAGRRLLILLDNAASSAAVAGLLPGSPSCGVLITSRNQLTGLDTRERLHLDVLAPDDAAALLAQVIGAERAGHDVAASNGLVERCGHLPLALRIVGARLQQQPGWTVARINELLDRFGGRLSELSPDGLGVNATFALSYDQLRADQQQLFRLLSLLPGRDLDQYGAAALTGHDPDDAADLAESLVDANLLAQPVPGRYEVHDLLREYAGSLAHDTDSPATLDAATDRLLEYYLHACLHPLARLAGMRYVGPVAPTELAVPDLDTQERSDAWADAEAGNLAAAVEYAAGHGRPTATLRLALAAVSFLTRRGMIQGQDRVLELAATAAQALGDHEAEARVLHTMGRLIRGQRGTHEAIARLQDARDRLPADGDLLLRGQIHCGLGHAYQTIDPYGQALPNLEEAIRIARTLRDEPLLSQGLTYLGILYNNQWEVGKSIRAFDEAVTIQRRLGPSGLLADALSGLAFNHLHLGRYEEAIAQATEGLAVALEVKNPYAPPFVLAHLAEAHRLNGDLETALATDRRAVEAAEVSGMLTAKWTTLLGLGESLLAIGDLDGAVACFRPVLEAATADKNTAYLVDAWECLAKHATVTGDPDLAVGYLSQAIAATEGQRSPQIQRLRDRLGELSR